MMDSFHRTSVQLLMYDIARLHEAASKGPMWEIETDSVAEALLKLGRRVIGQ